MPSTPPQTDNLESEIRAFGQAIWNEIREETPSVFNKNYWQGRMLEWAMKDPAFKVDLFRFVDVLPMLHTGAQISRHVREYLLKEGRELPGVLNTAHQAAWGSLVANLAGRPLKNHVAEMAKRFIVGHNAKEALPELRRLHEKGIAFSMDLLGEATLSNAEADAYQARYVDLFQNLPEAVSEWPANEQVDRNHLGPIPRTNISVKISALAPFLDPVDRAGAVRRLMDRALPLFLLARENNVFLNVDLEQWDLHGITYDLFEEIVTHPELRDWPHVGIVVQAYLKSATQDVERLRNLARKRGAPITVRLPPPEPRHTEYALTGAVYSRSPSHLEEAAKRFRVGNLYLNRNCTGSMVGRQPFGGFQMSGTDTKAGGPGYLLHFADPRVITENTMRRGFTPKIAL